MLKRTLVLICICSVMAVAVGCKKQNAGIVEDTSEKGRVDVVGDTSAQAQIMSYLAAIKNGDVNAAVKITGIYESEKQRKCADVGSTEPNYKKQRVIDDCIKSININENGGMSDAFNEAKGLIEAKIFTKSCEFDEIEVKPTESGKIIHYVKVSYPNKNDSYQSAKDLVIEIEYMPSEKIIQFFGPRNAGFSPDILSKYK